MDEGTLILYHTCMQIHAYTKILIIVNISILCHHGKYHKVDFPHPARHRKLTYKFLQVFKWIMDMDFPHLSAIFWRGNRLKSPAPECNISLRAAVSRKTLATRGTVASGNIGPVVSPGIIEHQIVRSSHVQSLKILKACWLLALQPVCGVEHPETLMAKWLHPKSTC